MTVTIDGTTGVNTPAVSGMTTPLSVGQGGTGLTTATGVLVGAGSSVSAVAAGTNGNILTSNGTTWVSQAAAPSGATGVPVLNVFTTPGTWTKPATIKAIKVTVIGGGGLSGSPANSGSATYGGGGGGAGGASVKIYPAPSLPGPQPYTIGPAGAASPAPGVGGSSSFGVAPITVISGAGGSRGTNANPGSNGTGGAGGTGSNGDMNISGQPGGSGAYAPAGSASTGVSGVNILGMYGGGGSAGVVVVEEFY